MGMQYAVFVCTCIVGFKKNPQIRGKKMLSTTTTTITTTYYGSE